MSCKRDYESGASKRKRKKQKEEQLKKTNKSFESYFLSSKKVNEKTLAGNYNHWFVQVII